MQILSTPQHNAKQASSCMTMILSPILFTQWGIDIIHPFPPSTTLVRFIFVVVDYFTMWVEAQVVAKITKNAIVKFFQCSIVCCFGVPQHIVTDNGSKFTGGNSHKYLKM